MLHLFNNAFKSLLKVKYIIRFPSKKKKNLAKKSKKVRRRNFYDPYLPHIVQYRNLKTPYPPKKVRRLLWTAPYVIHLFNED